MKVSNYTFLFENNNEYFIFNSLSKSFLQIDKEDFDILSVKQKRKAEISEQDIDKELFDELKKRLMLCENHKDEFLLFKSILMDIRNSDKNIHFTIAPTMDCCFSCFYCFEKGNHKKTYMTEEVMDSIAKNIENRKELQSIHITWFGGEPLMAIDKMQEFYKKFRKVWKGEFSSKIITTAHHITPEVIEVLKEIEVKSMQITLDGAEKTHNSIKVTKGCDNAFQKVISNIDLLVEKYPELAINIRINTTKKNAAEYIDLHKLIYQRYNGRNVNMYPGIVNDRSENRNTDKENDFFSNNDCALFSIDLWNEHKIATYWLKYQDTMFYECAIRNKNVFGIDPEGYLYQCWENIGNKKYAIGKLDKEGNITEINQKVLNRNLYGADPLANQECIECSYLPMCAGGCPINRIENEFEGRCNELCTTHKNYIKEWLSIYLELKKLGYFSKPQEEVSNETVS